MSQKLPGCSTSFCREWAVALAVLVCLCRATGAQQITENLEPRASEGRGEIIVSGKKIEYISKAEETFLYGKAGKTPFASIITFSYTRVNPDKGEKRPVVFFFNGGPGASSSPLHLHAFGPFVISQTARRSLIANENSLLDAADLVFVDPAGTGYTRVFNEDSAKIYWDVRGDALEVLSTIKSWIGKNGRGSSPLFICGESYGTMRLAEMIGVNEDLKISGAIMLSTIFDLTSSSAVEGNDIPYVTGLPTMAAIAYFHHQTRIRAKDAADIFNKASRFAEGDYFSALMKGSSINMKERDRIAWKLSAFTGLSADSLIAKNLRIKTEDYQVMLLAAQDKRIGILDGRKTGPLHTDLKPPYSDPSMSLGRDTVSGRLMKEYFNSALNFPDTGKYKSLNLNINFKWNWSSAQKDFYYTVIPEFSVAAMKNPGLRILIAGGIFDMATPLWSAKYQIDHSGIPPGRITFMTFPTGHSIFEDEVQLKILAGRLREFIQGR